MTNEHVLQELAGLMRPRLSAGNPLAAALYVTVADAKEAEATRTCAVLQTGYSSARELIPGNYTWQYPCRLYARFYPPQGDWKAEQMLGWMNEAALALVAALGALGAAPVQEQKERGFVVLDAVCTGGVSWRAEADVGYVGEVPFMVTVQF